jgi:hypothetical protein
MPTILLSVCIEKGSNKVMTSGSVVAASMFLITRVQSGSRLLLRFARLLSGLVSAVGVVTCGTAGTDRLGVAGAAAVVFVFVFVFIAAGARAGMDFDFGLEAVRAGVPGVGVEAALGPLLATKLAQDPGGGFGLDKSFSVPSSVPVAVLLLGGTSALASSLVSSTPPPGASTISFTGDVADADADVDAAASSTSSTGSIFFSSTTGATFTSTVPVPVPPFAMGGTSGTTLTFSDVASPSVLVLILVLVVVAAIVFVFVEATSKAMRSE